MSDVELCNSGNMTKINLFMNILFLLIAIILCAIPRCLSALSDKRLCYDPECSVPVSLAWTNIAYITNDPEVMSFDLNVNVTVYSKDAGTRRDLWGVEIKGKRGYVPKSFLREYKILKKNLTHEVPTVKFNEEDNRAKVSKDSKPKENDALNLSLKDNEKSSSTDNDISVIKSADESVKQSLVNTPDISPTYKVIEGTTIHFENNETTLEPSSVTQSIQATAVPSEQPLENFTPSTNSPTENLDSKQNQIHDVSSDETKEISKSLELKNNVTLDEAQNTAPLLDINTFKNLSDTDHKTDHKSDSNQANKNDAEGAKDSSESNNEFYVQKSTEKEKEKDRLKKGHVKKAKTTDKIENNVHLLGMILSEKVKKQELEGLKKENNIEQLPRTSESKLEVVEESINNTDVRVVESQTVEESSVQEEKDVPKNDEIKKEIPVDILKDGSNKVPDTSVQEEIKKTSNMSAESIPLSAENNFISGQDHVIGVIPVAVNEELTKVEEKETTETNNQNFTEETVSDTSNKVNVDRDLQETIIALNIDPVDNQEIIVNNTVNSNNNLLNDISSVDVPTETIEFSKVISDEINLQEQEQLDSSQVNVITEQISNLEEFQHNRNLLNVEENVEIENTGHDVKSTVIDITESLNSEALPKYGDNISDEDKVSYASTHSNDMKETEEIISKSSDVCMIGGDCQSSDTEKDHEFLQEDENSEDEEKTIMTRVKMKQNYWETFMYLGVTAFTALFFSLGYYFIENKRRDGELIAKINKLEKELLVSMKECTILSESLKTTKEKLSSIEDESFGSNEMVLSLKADLEVLQNTKAELEDQVVMLEKDLESATEAGLELERMLREVLSSNNEVNPLAQSVEDLQIRLNVQQAANESLTNALNLKTQENESLSAELASMKQKFEELEIELMQVSEKLKGEVNLKTTLEHTSTDKIQQLEFQVEQLSLEKLALQKDLKGKIAEVEDLAEVVNQVNSNNIDLNKLYDVSHIKAEATQLLEERDQLKVQLSEVEGAHHLLEEHMKLIKEEISALSDQYKQAEKEKKDAETRLEVLSNFFKEKETQRQKEEAIWLQKQGEVMSTVERIQTLQNELQNYKQQIEMLKREIVDQEREYKSKISLLETKAHEQWVIARQNERRLEESKTEAAQLRNRLTMIEKNLNEADPDTKLHRLETNGETATSPPLFIGAESSSSPIMFTGSSGVPPPPPHSYMHCSMFPPYLPPPLPSGSGVPPYEVGQRPPPLGGRLSSPPPMPLHPPASSRYDNAGSPPPPMSPHLLPPFNRHRSPPPPFGNDHIHPPPPPPPGSILPPPLGTSHSWGEESLPPLRNSGFHPHQREQRARNHKGSLHSSGESLDKTHHSGKV